MCRKLSVMTCIYEFWIVSISMGGIFEPFVINVSDAETGRGVALVELKTVNERVFLTDANGIAAIYEPGLMEAGEVFFHVKTPYGYKAWEKDGFGYRGIRLMPEQGGCAEIRLRREKEPTGLRPPDAIAEDAPLHSFRRGCPYDVRAGAYRPFEIVVKDAATGRGVPLVELWTRWGLSYLTDSAGRIALFEPSLMNEEITFTVKSYGYEGPADGVTFKTAPGGSGEVSIKRINIAERLYRITGEGIYRDSVLLNKPAPLAKPVLCGKVLGQDTVAMAEYKGRLFWLWGDTQKPSYPLGNFKTSSAWSDLPERGGLEPDIGVNLDYFVGADGFCKEMFPRKEPGLVWMFSAATVDEDGRERLVARYVAMHNGLKVYEQGMAVFNDRSETFEPLAIFRPQHNIANTGPAYKRDDFIYVNCPYPVMRYRATLAAAGDPNGYEAFTCLAAGTGFDGDKTKLERDTQGKLVWAWKRNTLPLHDAQWEQLVKAGLVEQEEAWNWMTDVETGKHVRLHYGSAAYNAYKDCWIMVFNEVFGRSFLGEVWIAAAKRPEGPWTKARKIVTHWRKDEPYSFYNVVQHPVFNRDGGRMIYFEGTYTMTFSGNENPTPGYDYNQMMYKLDLSDPRLSRVFK